MRRVYLQEDAPSRVGSADGRFEQGSTDPGPSSWPEYIGGDERSGIEVVRAHRRHGSTDSDAIDASHEQMADPMGVVLELRPQLEWRHRESRRAEHRGLHIIADAHVLDKTFCFGAFNRLRDADLLDLDDHGASAYEVAQGDIGVEERLAIEGRRRGEQLVG